MKRICGGPLRAWMPVRDGHCIRPVETKFKQHGLTITVRHLVNPKTGKAEEFTAFDKKTGITTCAITADGNILLIREYAQALGGFVWKFPAGVEKGDRPVLETARDEVVEETGYTPQNVVETSPEMFLLAPRKSPSGFRTFVATGCVHAGMQNLDEGEDAIEVWEVTEDDLWNMIDEGVILAIETVTAAYRAAHLGCIRFPVPTPQYAP